MKCTQDVVHVIYVYMHNTYMHMSVNLNLLKQIFHELLTYMWKKNKYGYQIKSTSNIVHFIDVQKLKPQFLAARTCRHPTCTIWLESIVGTL